MRRLPLSERAQCFHLEFVVDTLERFDFSAGQFLSAVAQDATGKQHTRAYSIASAPQENRFDICLNRVEGGFFSNLLCDLKVGETVQFHGPHGLFTLRNPIVDGIFIATGTGVAPMRGFVQHLFPESGPESGEDRSGGRNFWLVYGTRYETDLYYQDYFEKIAAERPNFHYLATLSRPHEGWQGTRGYVQELVGKIAEQGKNDWKLNGASSGIDHRVYAYICGLNDMVSANRDRLMGLGWEKKQIVFERYD